MLPDKTISFSATSCGLDSPVKEAVFKLAVPFTTTPSSGIFSPCFATTISPTFTSDGSTISISSPFFRLAYSGLISIKSDIDFLVLLIAFSSRILPIS